MTGRFLSLYETASALSRSGLGVGGMLVATTKRTAVTRQVLERGGLEAALVARDVVDPV